MNALSRHTGALQTGAVVTLTTIALTALPLLAADQYDESYYARAVVSDFERIGAMNTYAFDNSQMSASSFDFQKYFAHTCFKATEYDKQGCKEKFGPYADLRETYTSGKLAMILSRVSYLSPIAAVIPHAQVAAVPSTSVTQGQIQVIRGSCYYPWRGLGSLSCNSVLVPVNVPTSQVVPTNVVITPTNAALSSSSSRQSQSEYLAEERKIRAAQVWKICDERTDNRADASVCYRRNIRLVSDRTENITSDLVY